MTDTNQLNWQRTNLENIETAWEGDLWDRKRLGIQLTNYVDRLQCGAVLALDARWGEGKTWFVRHWKKHLEDENHNVIYLDAFANDYLEDPFLVISSEITSCLAKDDNVSSHINTFKEDLRSLTEEKFHITLLTLPVLGVVIFTLIPILLLIFVAFTNYDQQHMPPTELFSWVGFSNFISLFGGGGLTSTFGYAFVRVLGWTLVWAFFATFTTYIGGILLSLLLNSKKTRLSKMWRTLFIVTIAVPQFVSLLLVRNFFSNGGIVNTICHSIGLTGFLRSIGLVSTSYIPFLSAPGWAHVMIILINIWIGVPYQMLIATGVLMNLPSDQLESARVDGATNFQIFRKITMPYLLFVTGPALITDFVKNINNFNVIYLLTQDVYTTTNQAMASSQAKEVDLLVTWLFRLTQDYYNYKMASAIGIIVFIICAVFTLVAFNRMIKGDKEGTYQ